MLLIMTHMEKCALIGLRLSGEESKFLLVLITHN